MDKEVHSGHYTDTNHFPRAVACVFVVVTSLAAHTIRSVILQSSNIKLLHE